MRIKWENIEDILLQKDSNTTNAINSLLINLVEQENEVTSLLEQKASTQMSSISIVVTIVLATLGFLLRGFPENISKKKKNVFLSFYVAIMLIFVLSMYWSYKGFVVRNDFASYNIDDLFNIMKDKESNLTVFKISNILENYQIYVINTKVNFAKAASLALAARLFIVGIITFAISSLCVLIGIKK
jgi:hypothetical protein